MMFLCNIIRVDHSTLLYYISLFKNVIYHFFSLKIWRETKMGDQSCEWVKIEGQNCNYAFFVFPF